MLGFVVIWPDGEKFQKSVKICVTKMKYLRLTDEIKTKMKYLRLTDEIK